MKIPSPISLLALGICLVSPALAEQAPESPWFVERAGDFGMDDLGTGRGTVVLDFDGDGWVDLFQTHSDGPNALYKNLGNGFADVTEAAGVGGDRFHWGATVGDYDNDGDPDLYVSVGGLEGSGSNLLYRNDGNRFTEVAAAAGVAGLDAKSASPVWLDYDRDGWLDLYVANFNRLEVGFGEALPVCSQHVVDRMTAAGTPPSEVVDLVSNVLYRNNRDGTFTDVTVEAGLWLEDRSFGVTTGDFDKDGFIDIYLAGFKAPNRLYRNMQDGTFREVASAAGGLDAPWASMAPAFADFDNDGWVDLFVGTWNSFATGEFEPNEPNYLFRNLGDGTFKEIAARAGVEHIGGHMGVQVADFDLDGWLDLYLGSGGPNPWERQQDLLFHNNRAGGFDEITSEISGIENMFMAHGVAFADFDRDGDLDFFVGNGGPFRRGDWSNQPNRLYRNETTPNNSLAFTFEGVASNRAGLGAVIEAVDHGVTQRRELNGGSGFASHNGLAVRLGFGSVERVGLVTATWPSGVQQSLLDVEVNQRRKLVEPSIGVRVMLRKVSPTHEPVIDVALMNTGERRRVSLRVEILDSDHEVVDRFESRTLVLQRGAKRSSSFDWDAVDRLHGRHYIVGRLVDAGTGAELNVGAAPIDF